MSEPRTVAGRFLLANYDERPTNTLRVGILAIERAAVATYLASPDAEKALALALAGQNLYHGRHGTVPAGSATVAAILASWRELMK